MQNSLKSIPIQNVISFFIVTAFILYGDELENLTDTVKGDCSGVLAQLFSH